MKFFLVFSLWTGGPKRPSAGSRSVVRLRQARALRRVRDHPELGAHHVSRARRELCARELGRRGVTAARGSARNCGIAPPRRLQLSRPRRRRRRTPVRRRDDAADRPLRTRDPARRALALDRAAHGGVVRHARHAGRADAPGVAHRERRARAACRALLHALAAAGLDRGVRRRRLSRCGTSRCTRARTSSRTTRSARSGPGPRASCSSRRSRSRPRDRSAVQAAGAPRRGPRPRGVDDRGARADRRRGARGDRVRRESVRAVAARSRRMGAGSSRSCAIRRCCIQPPLMLLGAACAAVPLALAVVGGVMRRGSTAPVARGRCARGRWRHGAALGVVPARGALGLRLAGACGRLRAGTARPWSRAPRSGPLLTALLVASSFAHASGAPHSEADLLRRAGGPRARGSRRAPAASRVSRRVRCRETTTCRSATAGSTARRMRGATQWTFTSQGASRMERQGNDVIALASCRRETACASRSSPSESRAVLRRRRARRLSRADRAGNPQHVRAGPVRDARRRGRRARGAAHQLPAAR